MPLTADWLNLQATFTEYPEASIVGGRHTIVLSIPVSGSTARASTAVAAYLLRGLVNDYFDTYETPLNAQWVSISNTGPLEEAARHSYSLAIHLVGPSATAFVEHASAAKTAIVQALEDLPKTLDQPDGETVAVAEAFKAAKVLDDEFVDA